MSPLTRIASLNLAGPGTTEEKILRGLPEPISPRGLPDVELENQPGAPTYLGDGWLPCCTVPPPYFVYAAERTLKQGYFVVGDRDGALLAARINADRTREPWVVYYADEREEWHLVERVRPVMGLPGVAR